MWFWIKNITLTIVLLFISAYLLVGDPSWFKTSSSPQQTSKPEPTAQIKRPTYKATKKEEPEIAGDGGTFTMTRSSAATGLSRFYGKVKEELLGNSNTIGDGFVIKLKPSVYSLDEQLQRRGSMVKPGSEDFDGEILTHHFRKGETMRNQLTIAAEQEGMALIWQLERDYIIKHYFKVDSDLLSTLSTVAKALNSDFEKDVYAFYCFAQRAVIITNEFTDYVRQQCREVKTKRDEQN